MSALRDSIKFAKLNVFWQRLHPQPMSVQDKMLALNNQMVAVEYDKQVALMGIAECLERMEKL